MNNIEILTDTIDNILIAMKAMQEQILTLNKKVEELSKDIGREN